MDFAELMKKEDWKEMTCIQLRKDFRLSGNVEPNLDSSDMSCVLTDMISAIELAKSKKASRDSLNYCIDIPQLLNPDNLMPEDLARMFLIRCFQKVWTRRHYESMH